MVASYAPACIYSQLLEERPGIRNGQKESFSNRMKIEDQIRTLVATVSGFVAANVMEPEA